MLTLTVNGRNLVSSLDDVSTRLIKSINRAEGRLSQATIDNLLTLLQDTYRLKSDITDMLMIVEMEEEK